MEKISKAPRKDISALSKQPDAILLFLHWRWPVDTCFLFKTSRLHKLHMRRTKFRRAHYNGSMIKKDLHEITLQAFIMNVSNLQHYTVKIKIRRFCFRVTCRTQNGLKNEEYSNDIDKLQVFECTNNNNKSVYCPFLILRYVCAP